MNRHPGEISAAVQEGHNGVVVLDRAGWPRSKRLEVPANLSLLHLPPYAMENVCNAMKSTHHAKRVFETLDDVKAHVLAARQAFIKRPERMASVMHRKWAVAQAT